MITTFIDGTAATSPSCTALSDDQLVERMRDGSADALEAFIRRFAGLVVRIADRILSDRAEAEDVAQEIFLEVFRKASLFDPSRGSAKVWLLQYVYHRTLRRKQRLARRAAYRGEPLEVVDERFQHPPARLTRDECRWTLYAGLAQLPERQRTTLELTCFEDLTLRDVADRLGVSLGCTRHYYYRGLARLQHWARITAPPPVAEIRIVSRGDRADAATGRAPTPLAQS